MAAMTFEHAPARAPRRSAELSAVLYREFVLLTGNRAALLFGMVPMLVYLLLVATSLSNVVGVVDYNATKVPFFVFLLPFVVTMSVVGASGTTGMALFQYALDAMRDLSVFGYSSAWPSLLVLCAFGVAGNVIAVRGLLRRTREL